MSDQHRSSTPGGPEPDEEPSSLGLPACRSRFGAGRSHRDVRLTQPPRPASLYTAHNLRPACSLRYDWTGWPTEGTTLPATTAELARATASAWEPDGLHLLEAHATPAKVQLLFSATPGVSPVFCCQRAKGRLQHALHKASAPVEFSRKVAFRALGENTDAEVAGYIRKQVDKERLADPRFEAIMRQFTVTAPDVDLAQPSASASGRYWYNLHVVLVVADRFRITNPEKLGKLRDAASATASETGCRIAALSVMPDHIHMALRGAIARSPEDIALAFLNGLARAAGCRVWQDGYYAGTFSEYDLDVIRRIAGKS